MTTPAQQPFPEEDPRAPALQRAPQRLTPTGVPLVKISGEGPRPEAGLDASCRFCSTRLPEPFLDLGMSPLANRYVRAAQLHEMEPFYPLQLHHCPTCSLVQLRAFETPSNIFGDYAYFSSYSDSWLAHARRYATEAAERFGLGPESLVVEIASNDGYLLRNFVEMGIPVVGVEPAQNVAAVARAAGIPTVARTPRRTSRPGAGSPICSSGTTCSPTSPTSTTSWPA
jgi:hypothetical protein